MGFFRSWRIKRKAKREKEDMPLEELNNFRIYRKKGFISQDIWNLDNWLTETFPKMIRELADTTHGYPQEEFEEIEEFPLEWTKNTIDEINRKRQNKIEITSPFDIDNEADRWELILLRMAYCFERADKFEDFEENEYSEEYFNQVFGRDHKMKKHESFKKWWKRRTIKVEGGYQLIEHEPDEELQKNYYNREREIWENKVAYKNEALDLLKKYFYDLWD